MSTPADKADLADPTRLGRLLTELEDNPRQATAILAALPEPDAVAQRIGFTGSPGVGKSTLVNRVIEQLCLAGRRVAVIAVDPTSAISGGAVLGDRIRLSSAANPGVFIRSMASRGSLGGITPAASASARVLEAAGYDTILIETVGVGQTGYDIVSLADTVVALFSPESGDGIQLLKAGIMEVGDIYAVNKCDRPGADLLAGEITASLDVAAAASGHHLTDMPAVVAGSAEPAEATADWQPPVLRVSARDNIGITPFVEALVAHGEWLKQLPAGHPVRLRRIERELRFIVSTELAWAAASIPPALINELAAGVVADPTAGQAAIARLRRFVGKIIDESWTD